MSDDSLADVVSQLRKAKRLLHEAFDEMCHEESWAKRARALGIKGDPCGDYELRARNAPVDDYAKCGWPYQQGYVAGRDGQSRNSNPRRARPRRLWDDGWMAGHEARKEKAA